MPYERALIALLTAAALGLRLVVAGDSLFGDEVFTYEIATRDGLGDVLDGVAGDLEITPPLFFVFAWVFQQLGDPDFWLRAPSIAAGTLLVPVTWLLGRRTVGPAAGVVGAALVALSPFAIFYSTEARAYALMTLLAALATYALLRATETRANVHSTTAGGGQLDVRRGFGWWVAYAAATAAALYTHYTAVFAIGAQAAWVLVFHRDLLRPLAGAYAAAFVAYIPWIPELIDDRANDEAQAAIGVLAPFGVDTFFEHVGRWSLGSAYISLRDLPGTPLLVILVGLLLVAAAAGARRLELGPAAALVALLALAAPVGAVAWTAVAQGSIFIDRNLLVALPALALAAGALLTAPPPRAAVTLSVAFTAIFAFLALDSTRDEYSRPDYEAAGNYIEAHSEPGEPVLDMTVLTPVGPPSDQLAVQLSEGRPLFKTHVAFPSPRVEADALRAARGRRLYALTAGVDPDLDGSSRLELVETVSWPGRFRLRLSVYRVG